MLPHVTGERAEAEQQLGWVPHPAEPRLQRSDPVALCEQSN